MDLYKACLRKNLVQESTCQKDERLKQTLRLVDYKKRKKKKKAPAMTSYLKARVNMLTLGVTCTSFLIAHALLHSGACCPGRGGRIWL